MEYIIDHVKFTDADVVEIDNFIPKGEYNPHNVRPWLLHDHGMVLCVVFASNLQEALDMAVDENKLDALMISKEDYGDYGMDTDEPTCTFLGNAGEPFDIETVSYIELPNPPMSWVAMLAVSLLAKHEEWIWSPAKGGKQEQLSSHPASGQPPREHRVIQLD